MTIAYCYNDEYKYTGMCECDINPMASMRLGYEVPLVPGHATLEPVPEFDEETQECIYDPESDSWTVKDLPVPEEPVVPEEQPADENATPQPTLEERVAELERGSADTNAALNQILEVYNNE